MRNLDSFKSWEHGPGTVHLCSCLEMFYLSENMPDHKGVLIYHTSLQNCVWRIHTITHRKTMFQIDLFWIFFLTKLNQPICINKYHAFEICCCEHIISFFCNNHGKKTWFSDFMLSEKSDDKLQTIEEEKTSNGSTSEST